MYKILCYFFQGVAIAGKGGVASSKPNAIALAGIEGLAVASPKATAIAGVTPEEAAAFSVSFPHRPNLIIKSDNQPSLTAYSDSYYRKPATRIRQQPTKLTEKQTHTENAKATIAASLRNVRSDPVPIFLSESSDQNRELHENSDHPKFGKIIEEFTPHLKNNRIYYFI